MAKALTDTAVKNAVSQGKRREVPDGLMPGLYLVVQASGAKSWAVRFRLHGRPTKFTLGRYPGIGLAKARELARAKLQDVAAGADPPAERRKERARTRETGGSGFRAVAARFIARYAKKATRETSWRETERLLNKHVVPVWKDRPIDAITGAHVVALLDDIVDAGTPILANRVLAAVRRLFNWAIEKQLLKASPCAGLRRPAKESARDRVLAETEIRLLWQACEGQGWPFGPLVKLLLLTGQRRDEVAEMRWGELDLDRRVWTIPRERAKNDVAHEVPLSDAAMAVLKTLPVIAGGAGYVFTTTGETPVSGFSRAKAGLDKALLKACEGQGLDPLPRWTFHDLRRTMASGMAGLGIALPVIEKVLNHVSGSFAGVTGVYQRHSFADEKRRALEAWAAHVERIVHPPAENVVAIRGGGGR